MLIIGRESALSPHLQPLPRRRRQALAAAAAVTSIAAFAVAAAPASATHAQSQSTHNLSIFHNLDFVAVSGFDDGDKLTIAVDRPGVGQIASLRADARPGEAAGDFGLELNHGPAGDPELGDCWTNYVPDILPGDTVSVTYPVGEGTATDSDVVDDIQITRGMFTAGSDVAFEGIALDAAGNPINVATLDSGETRADGATPRVRAAVTRVVAIPGVPGGFRALHERAQNYGLTAGTATLDQIHAGLLNFGDPAIGYGHLEPPPPFVQLVEGISSRQADGIPGGGPAIGCPPLPFERNSIETLDRSAINAANAGSPIVVNGRAATGVTAGDIEIRVDDTVVNDAVVTVNAATRSWSATIPDTALLLVADGPVTIEARFAGAFRPVPGARVTTVVLEKDTSAPAAPSAKPGTGTYTGAQSVELTAEAGATIHYTNSGAAPTTTSPVASGPIAVTASQTLRAIAVDAAGNVSPEAVLTYGIQTTATAPGTPGTGTTGTGTTSVTVGAGLGGAEPAGSARPLSLGLLTMSKSIKRQRARRDGLRVTMRLQQGTEVVGLRIYRKLRNGRRVLLATGFRAPRAIGLYRVRLADPSVRRRLTPGNYELEATPGRSRADLGRAARHAFKVTAR